MSDWCPENDGAYRAELAHKAEVMRDRVALSAAMGLPEVKALVKAARPFYAAVFNDNGDVTISTGHITTGDWLALDTALAAIKEQKT